MKSSSSNHDVERMIEDWLAEEASPLPDPVMTSIVDGLARHSQVGRRRVPDLSRGPWRITTAAMAAVLLVVAVAIGPGLIRDLSTLLGSRSGAGPPDADAMHWDAMAQFREYPIQLNPAPDGYGHTNVFTYLYATGLDHDPGRYVPFSDFQVAENRWYEPAIPDLSVGGTFEDSLRMHPAGGGVGGHAAIVAWRAPVDASLLIEGQVEVDASCGDGIIFWVEDQSEVYERFVLSEGSQAFSIAVHAFLQGEALYFIVEPGGDSACDSTWLTATINTQ